MHSEPAIKSGDKREGFPEIMVQDALFSRHRLDFQRPAVPPPCLDRVHAIGVKDDEQPVDAALAARQFEIHDRTGRDEVPGACRSEETPAAKLINDNLIKLRDCAAILNMIAKYHQKPFS